MKAALLDVVGERLNPEILNKVVRNAASSWTQSGHLEGRALKKRRRVRPTPTNVAFSLFLGRCAGFRGAELFASGWMLLLDCSPPSARELSLEAKRQGLINLSDRCRRYSIKSPWTRFRHAGVLNYGTNRRISPNSTADTYALPGNALSRVLSE